MTEFKVGDHIRLTDKSEDKTGETEYAWKLRTGTIVDINPASLYPFVATSDDGVCKDYVFAAEELELVEDAVEHPQHYGGRDNPYEVIKVAEAWGLDKDAYLVNVLKYIARAGKKSADTELQDNEKAYFYLGRKIKRLKELAQ